MRESSIFKLVGTFLHTHNNQFVNLFKDGKMKLITCHGFGKLVLLSFIFFTRLFNRILKSIKLKTNYCVFKLKSRTGDCSNDFELSTYANSKNEIIHNLL